MNRYFAIAALGFAGLLAGCGNTAHFPYKLGEEGVEEFKRIEKFAQADVIHHLRKTAYLEPTPGRMRGAGEDGKVLIDDLGRPDWVRRPFRSLQEERVEEWLYVYDDLMFQFVDGWIVYEGPITDMEITLLQRGYPRLADVMRAHGEDTDIVFVYDSFLKIDPEIIHFKNGRRIVSGEGN